VLDQGAQTGRAVNVFVVATDGRISCLDAQTGQAHWSWHDLEQRNFFVASTPAVVNIPTPEGTRRQIYFGVWAKVNPITNEAYLYCLEDVLAVP
jgi:outer membrane protein assembly factor BamB